MHIFETKQEKIAYHRIGQQGEQVIIWGHGWGQNHQSFIPLAESLTALGDHIILDFPGFGQSPVPFDRIENSWSSKDYADSAARLIKELSPNKPVIWIGHSFGCRVGTQLAAHYPALIKSVIFIAGAGLKRRRNILQTLILKTKIAVYKAGKPFKKYFKNKSAGSTDYQNAGPMRGTLIKVVNENLTAEAAKISCPSLLLYGENDTETPPEIGERLSLLMTGSKMVHLPNQDHYTVLAEGRHQVAPLIKKFIEQQS